MEGRQWTVGDSEWNGGVQIWRPSSNEDFASPCWRNAGPVSGMCCTHLGMALDGERTYIFEQNASAVTTTTYEWVADGVKPEKEDLQNVPPGVRELVSENSASAGILS